VRKKKTSSLKVTPFFFLCILGFQKYVYKFGEVKDIPLSKQITSHSFPVVKDDNTLKYRTVAHGNRQSEETFTTKSYGNIHPVTINLLLVKALHANIIPYQIDIAHAFLDGVVHLKSNPDKQLSNVTYRLGN